MVEKAKRTTATARTFGNHGRTEAKALEVRATPPSSDAAGSR